jgi:acetyl-CoA carboxylase biotin carboxyl carrier protein
MAASAAAPAGGAAPAAPKAADSDAGLIAIESPMVGTFYSAANPDSPPFAAAGAKITPSTVVCLIEAMKVFNEIKAEKSGTIERVLVKNGDAVEFGQKLFLVRP